MRSCLRQRRPPPPFSGAHKKGNYATIIIIRKDTTLNNFTDTYNHLWDRSRQVIVEMERKIKRRPVKVVVGTEIESVVESMFLEEACG